MQSNNPPALILFSLYKKTIINQSQIIGNLSDLIENSFITSLTFYQMLPGLNPHGCHKDILVSKYSIKIHFITILAWFITFLSWSLINVDMFYWYELFSLLFFMVRDSC